jgi:hypothetical protein
MAENQVSLSWVVERPITKDLITSFVNDVGFSGFYVNYYDTGRSLIFTDTNAFNRTNYKITSQELFSIFSSITGSNSAVNYNQFFIDIVSQDFQGRTSTGTALINFGVPSVQISGYSIDNTTNLNLNYTDRQIIESLDLFVTTGQSFDPSSQDYLYYANYNAPSLDNVYVPDLIRLNQNQLTDNEIRLPYYVHLIPYSYFSSGQKITSSGIKPSSYSEAFLPEKINNVTGYAFNNFNKTSKELDLNIFVKWDAITESQDCSFHVLVEESGSNSNKYDYFLQNRSLDKISSILYGTGTGLSSSGTIFQN